MFQDGEDVVEKVGQGLLLIERGREAGEYYLDSWMVLNSYSCGIRNAC